jgi:transposase InsO family protein
VLFERICRENGITPRLTKPRSPTTTGKIERLRVGVLRAARRAELCGFRWADTVLERPYIDPETAGERMGALLGVERPIIQIGGKLRESKPKTKMGQRRVFLDHETAELLREHRKAQLRLRLKAGEAWQDNDLIFC